ncbi:30S ribosomal protein S6 [Patescibacteria group bacterium]|nr:30S ribosomal protein S6 [Patescibacteria group bacterium]MBU1963213.1 30S ribosomal protein S6 [Patescibacteria group bacterium]
MNDPNKGKIYMEHYEVLFIVPGAMKDEEAAETIGKVKKLLEDLGAKITKEENWGRKSLAYQIKHETQGIYGLFEFDMEKDKLEELNKRMRLSREILRHLVIKARIKTAEEVMEDEKVEEKIAARKKEAMKQELDEAEQEKKEEAEIKPKKVVEEEAKPVEVKVPTPEDEKVSMEDLDKKLDELLNEDIE